MSATSRRKGARAEVAAVTWLRANGWPHAERRLSGATGDTGDVTGIPGVVFDVKDCARLELARWCDQLTTEMTEAETKVGALIVKRKGRTDPGDWYGVLPVSVLARLLREAGWGEPLEREDDAMTIIEAGR